MRRRQLQLRHLNTGSEAGETYSGLRDLHELQYWENDLIFQAQQATKLFFLSSVQKGAAAMFRVELKNLHSLCSRIAVLLTRQSFLHMNELQTITQNT